MFVIAGVTGHVGSVVAQELLAKKQPIKVIVRNTAKGAAWSKKGAQVAVGTLDAAVCASVVKGLARLHGGDLSLKSKLGEGTVATLLLPLEGHIEALARTFLTNPASVAVTLALAILLTYADAATFLIMVTLRGMIAEGNPLVVGLVEAHGLLPIVALRLVDATLLQPAAVVAELAGPAHPGAALPGPPRRDGHRVPRRRRAPRYRQSRPRGEADRRGQRPGAADLPAAGPGVHQ